MPPPIKALPFSRSLLPPPSAPASIYFSTIYLPPYNQMVIDSFYNNTIITFVSAYSIHHEQHGFHTGRSWFFKKVLYTSGWQCPPPMSTWLYPLHVLTPMSSFSNNGNAENATNNGGYMHSLTPTHPISTFLLSLLSIPLSLTF